MQNKAETTISPELEFLSKNLRMARAHGNLSLGDLSKITGLSKSFLSTIEAGKTSPNLHALIVLARTFDCTVSDLIDGYMFEDCQQCNGSGVIKRGEVKIQ